MVVGEAAASTFSLVRLCRSKMEASSECTSAVADPFAVKVRGGSETDHCRDRFAAVAGMLLKVKVCSVRFPAASWDMWNLEGLVDESPTVRR